MCKINLKVRSAIKKMGDEIHRESQKLKCAIMLTLYINMLN